MSRFLAVYCKKVAFTNNSNYVPNKTKSNPSERNAVYIVLYEQHTASYVTMVLLAMTTNLSVHLLDALRIARRPRCLYNNWVGYR